MLVVVPAAQAPEISSSRALRVAKEYDAECKLLSSVNKVEFLRKKSEYAVSRLKTERAVA